LKLLLASPAFKNWFKRLVLQEEEQFQVTGCKFFSEALVESIFHFETFDIQIVFKLQYFVLEVFHTYNCFKICVLIMN
jgi:hypothetical protein